MELHTTSSSMCNYELMTSHRSVIDISHGHQVMDISHGHRDVIVSVQYLIRSVITWHGIIVSQQNLISWCTGACYCCCRRFICCVYACCLRIYLENDAVWTIAEAANRQTASAGWTNLDNSEWTPITTNNTSTRRDWERLLTVLLHFKAQILQAKLETRWLQLSDTLSRLVGYVVGIIIPIII